MSVPPASSAPPAAECHRVRLGDAACFPVWTQCEIPGSSASFSSLCNEETHACKFSVLVDTSKTLDKDKQWECKPIIAGSTATSAEASGKFLCQHRGDFTDTRVFDKL